MFSYNIQQTKKVEQLQAKLVNLRFSFKDLETKIDKYTKEINQFYVDTKNGEDFSEQEKLMMQIKEQDIVDLKIEIHQLDLQIKKTATKLLSAIDKLEKQFAKENDIVL